MEAAANAIEPEFLSQALARAASLRIGQVSKSEQEGVLREIGRYEINVETSGGIITILKQDISFLSTALPLIEAKAADPPAAAKDETASSSARPNIQQEFLDKAIRERHHVTIFLLSGQRIKATLEGYDNFTILLRDGGRQHLYYKHAITTINR